MGVLTTCWVRGPAPITETIMPDTIKWNADRIAAAVNSQLFKRSVLMVPRCSWTGSECDLLVITQNLRIIDVEIKISRADLKADIRKDKWYHKRPWSRRHEASVPRAWPDRVWKHYYVMPASIWDPGLLKSIPEASGVLTVRAGTTGAIVVGLVRKAKPCRDAKAISPQDAIDIARLTSLRLWASMASSSVR